MLITNLTPHTSTKNKVQEQSIEEKLRQMLDEQRELEKQNRELTLSL